MYNATFAAKWLKVYVNLQLLHLFLQNHVFLQLLQLLQLNGHPDAYEV